MKFQANILWVFLVVILILISAIGIRLIVPDHVPTTIETTSNKSEQQDTAPLMQPADILSPESAKKRIDISSQKTSSWDGPFTGPRAQTDRTIVYFADDLRNGGILTVGEAVRQAANAIGWNAIFLDAQGTEKGRTTSFERILEIRPDGVIIGGADAFANLHNLNLLQHEGIKIVGWHVNQKPGPVVGTPIITNITTDNLQVAEIAAYYATLQSSAKVGAVIFTDSRYKIAMDKANTMKKVMELCTHCEVLSFEDVSLSKADKLVPGVVDRLLKAYGKRWTHSLAINDLYFDYMAPIFATKGLSFVERISNISAGDGSPSAFQRIRVGSYQNATVAEPLRLHGWQLVDELNRVFAGEPVSGYTNPVHLVIKENIAFDGGGDDLYDPDNGYKETYRSIWGK